MWKSLKRFISFKGLTYTHIYIYFCCLFFTAHRRMRTVTNYFLVNLSLADLMMSLLNCAFNFIFLLNSSWPFGSVYCTISNFVAHVTVASSVFTLVVISFDRYVLVFLLLFLFLFFLSPLYFIYIFYWNITTNVRYIFLIYYLCTYIVLYVFCMYELISDKQYWMIVKQNISLPVGN